MCTECGSSECDGTASFSAVSIPCSLCGLTFGHLMVPKDDPEYTAKELREYLVKRNVASICSKCGTIPVSQGGGIWTKRKEE
jgi:hypothetical protein